MTETGTAQPDGADGDRADPDRADGDRADPDRAEADDIEAALDTVADALDALDADDLDRAETLADSLIDPPADGAGETGAPSEND